MELSPLEMPPVILLLKSFWTFYGTPSFITVFTRAPVPNQINPVHTTTSYFFNIYFNIINPPTSDRDSEFPLRKKRSNKFYQTDKNFNLDKTCSKQVCTVSSKAFSISNNTAAVDMLLLKINVTCSLSLVHWLVVLWATRKSNWLALNRPHLSTCVWTIFRINFWNSLPVIYKRQIGHTLWGNFGPIPDFGNDMTSVISKNLESETAEDSDSINVSDIQVVSLESASGVSGVCDCNPLFWCEYIFKFGTEYPACSKTRASRSRY
jgi:hypothetical protein